VSPAKTAEAIELPFGLRTWITLDNFVAWDEQIIMLKTGSKSVQKWRRYNQLKFGAFRNEFGRSAD